MLLLVGVSVAVLMRARTVIGERSAVLASTRIGSGVVFAETLLLALAGCAIGGALAAGVLPDLREITPTVIPRLGEVGFNVGVVAFTVVLVVVVTLAVAILPASRASRTDTATRGWGGAIALVVLAAVQMALAFALIAACSLAKRAVDDLRGRDVGINPAGMLSADVYLPRKPYVTRQSAIETELAELTAEKEALDAWLATPDAYVEDAKPRLVESMERAGALTWSLARLEAEWLELAETLERLDAARDA